MNNIKVVEEVGYTGKFKIGEEVRITAVTNNEHEWERYLSDLGRVGIITTIDKHDEYSYYVQFNTGGEEWFNEATLELVTEQVNNKEKEDDEMNIKMVNKADYTGRFKVGDKVEVIAVERFKVELNSGLKNVGKRGIITKIIELINIDSYHYLARLEDGLLYWFNEAELELVTEQNNDIDSLKLKTFEILTGETDVKYIEKELRDYAELAVDDYDYDRAIEIYALIKEWNSLK